MGKYTTPRVPIQTPMFDERGLLTRTWIIFFERLKYAEAADITEITEAGAGELKATFGLLRNLTVEQDLTNHFICRTGGTFVNCVVNCKIPPNGTAARLTIDRSFNAGLTWNAVFAGPSYIELAADDTSVQTFDNFAAPPHNVIEPDNLLRINCVQKGSVVAGKDIEVVLRWAEPEAG